MSQQRALNMDGYEVSPGVFLLGPSTPIPGTNRLRCLANYHGALALVEVSVSFDGTSVTFTDQVNTEGPEHLAPQTAEGLAFGPDGVLRPQAGNTVQ